MKFLDKVMQNLLSQHKDLLNVNIVLPGKRPIVFIKKILKEKQYSGFLPQFFTIEDLIQQIAEKTELKGIGLWLFAYQQYSVMYPDEDLASFLKWFPTMLKDWDDMLKFSQHDKAVLDFMLDEERIKIWAENLAADSETPRNKFLNFWQKMNQFLPFLKQKLSEKSWATSGMIHEEAFSKIESFSQNNKEHWVFVGFNALTPIEEKLIKSLLQWDKAQCFFQADHYYIEDTKQEAGKFLRKHMLWKEFNDNRSFSWIENEFHQTKNIKVYEVSGNVSQAKILPDIINEIPPDEISETAVVLLDENLLPATIETLSMVDYINITMGFPLKNLAFSNAIKQIFYLQKQLSKKDSSYYYSDVMAIVDALPATEEELSAIQRFKNEIEERNRIYISKKLLSDYLSPLSVFPLLLKPNSAEEFVDSVIDYCGVIKERDLDDVLYENVSHLEQAFVQLKNHWQQFPSTLSMEALEVLVQQLVQQESIDFQGEPLQGLQVMGLLETRLLNFKNSILLSVNEGKLPLGNTQNTFLPHDVRTKYGLPTFLENDSIYAYHFYRFLQGAQNVHLLYNALSSGVNTGEKSRFIAQLEIESPHNIQHIIIDNSSEPVAAEPITIPKSAFLLEKLEAWKSRVSVSHLNSYLYNPIDFYLNTLMKTKESVEMEEELSIRNYGNLVHYALEFLYTPAIGKRIDSHFIISALNQVDESIRFAIEKLKHQLEYYDRGMNYIHKTMATKVLHQIINYDKALIEDGNVLEIIDLEYRFENIHFELDSENHVQLYGYIDRIDKLNGNFRVIDYKTAKTKGLNLKIEEKNIETYFFNSDKKQAMQLCIYRFVMERLPQFENKSIEPSIWSFSDVGKGPEQVEFSKCDIQDALVSIKNIILEILNPEMNFIEKLKE